MLRVQDSGVTLLKFSIAISLKFYFRVISLQKFALISLKFQCYIIEISVLYHSNFRDFIEISVLHHSNFSTKNTPYYTDIALKFL